MTKIDLAIETLENGYILSIDGKKYIVKNTHEIARRILMCMDPAFIDHRYKKPVGFQFNERKTFWKDKVGINQKKILELLKKENLTAMEITDKLYSPDMVLPKANFLFNIRENLRKLAYRDFIERLSATSEKYRLKEINSSDAK